MNKEDLDIITRLHQFTIDNRDELLFRGSVPRQYACIVAGIANEDVDIVEARVFLKACASISDNTEFLSLAVEKGQCTVTIKIDGAVIMYTDTVRGSDI